MKNQPWHMFKPGKWSDSINVRDFILNNYTVFDTEPDFLTGPSEHTQRVFDRYESLRQEELKRNGVLNVDTKTVSSLLTFEPGYLIKEDEVIVGLQTDEPLKRAVNPFGGIRMARSACEAYGYTLSKKVEDEFTYKTTHNDGVFRVYTQEMLTARKTGIITGLPDAYGRGRIIGDYRRVALYGVNALIASKKADKKLIENGDFLEDDIQLLEELHRQIDFLNKLIKMAQMYGYDISRPADTAQEAIQWTYFAYLAAVKEQNGAAMSLGRVSNFFDIYIERDLSLGVITEKEAQELIDQFVIKLRMVRQLRTPEYNDLFAGDPNWVTEVIGGLTQDKVPLVTKTSYRMLQTLYNLSEAPEPNLTILWSNQLPKPFKDFCAKVSIDTDSIQYENDDLMRPIFGDDYGIACCVSAMRIGEQMQYFGARCNMPKILLLALNGGKEEIEGIALGPQMETVTEGPLVYEEVLKRFEVYQEWLAKLYVNTMNVIHRMHDKYAYEKIQMALHDTQVERLMAFGMAGLSVMADSLSAIKYAKVTPIKDDRGIISDFKIEGDYPKYGNNDDRVDSIAVEITEQFFNTLKKHPLYRNATPTLSILTITSNVVYGKKTGSTPDGRKQGEPFAPGANPMHGRDSKGAIASLESVAKIPYDCCRDGISCTFSIHPKALGKSKVDQVINLVGIMDGYFSRSAHHLNVNVLNPSLLIEAMENPEKYPNLTVRVSGYAVNFNRLNIEQQKEVIARTYHTSV